MSLSLPQPCTPATFPTPTLFGASVLSISASLVSNFTTSIPAAFRFTQPTIDVHNASFCNVTVTYTHPGQNDKVHVEAWLPVHPPWNGRLQATGGGSWAAGRFILSYQNMAGAVAEGYAATTTDAGVSPDPNGVRDWALLSPGNVDLNRLNVFGSVSLGDQAIIGKAVIRAFYERDASFSYWNGCSGGGRQGMMLAQRYPDAYDGIIAGAPGIYWPELLAGGRWPRQVMETLGSYPYGCELDTITAAAIAACDGLDGVVDGVVGEVDACLDTFDPFTLVGSIVDECPQAPNRGPVLISRAAAVVASEAWKGPIRDGDDGRRRLGYGLSPGADLTGNDPSYRPGPDGVAFTNCTSGTCIGKPSSSFPWFQLLVAKDPSFNLGNLTNQQYFDMAHAGKQQYNSILGTDDPDLSRFRDSGGKIITFHGLADQAVPPKGTEHYYQAVSSALSNVENFYRHFEAPGLGHCFGGRSGNPITLFDQLRAWVENGTAPESVPVEVTGLDGEVEERILCPYPQRAEPNRNGTCRGAAADCWLCVDRPRRSLSAGVTRDEL